MTDKKVKSAFELAMERLEKSSGPAKKLTDEQKARISELEKVYAAKIAEARLDFDQKMAGADAETAQVIKSEMVNRIVSLEEERESKREKIWDE